MFLFSTLVLTDSWLQSLAEVQASVSVLQSFVLLVTNLVEDRGRVSLTEVWFPVTRLSDRIIGAVCLEVRADESEPLCYLSKKQYQQNNNADIDSLTDCMAS